jgi:hypothetical protein
MKNSFILIYLFRWFPSLIHLLSSAYEDTFRGL